MLEKRLETRLWHLWWCEPIYNLYKATIICLLFICLAVIFYFSSQDYHEQNIKPVLYQYLSEGAIHHVLPDIKVSYNGRVIDARNEPYRFIEFMVRKLAHLLLYGFLGFGLFVCIRSFTRLRLLKNSAVTLMIVFTIAVADELNQSGRWNRVGSFSDVIIDMVGASLGILIVIAAIKFKSLKRDRNSSS